MNYHTFPWGDIIRWHHIHGRHTLPWRDYSIRPLQTLIYRVWISEIFLQQTQAERVIPFFEKVIARFPDINALADTDYDTFFPYYQGLGYYSRARNILKTAAIISEEYHGIFPEEKSLLTSLPGIGEYTSSAILAFGYGMPFLTWDTNLEKIFSRYYFGSKDHRLSHTEKIAIEMSFRDFLSTQHSNQQKDAVRAINNGLMDIARLIPDKNPDTIDWEAYPIQWGKWFESRGSTEERSISTRDIFPTPDATIIAILHENHTVYFSASQDTYMPFILPPALSRNTRHAVQAFFREVHGLEVSVRPVHKKWFSKKWEPFVAVNVQIQMGKHQFSEYSRTDAKALLNEIEENI